MTRAGASNGIDDLFATAQRHHEAGRLEAAEAACRKILGINPRHADSLHLAGVIAHQTGRGHAAAQMIGKALALEGKRAAYHNSLGVVLTAQGKLTKAVASFRRALAIEPDDAQTHNNLGIALKAQGRSEDAVACYREALALAPDYAVAHNNLGNALIEQGDRDEAAACFRRALALAPDYAEAHNGLGVARKDEDPTEAAASFRRALTLQPRYAQAHNNLGNMLAARGELEAAVSSFRQALAVQPDYAEAHRNLADALRVRGELEAAAAECRAALALDPDDARAHHSLGDALIDQCRLDEAIACYRRALALEPQNAAFHSSLLFALNYHDGLSPKDLAAEARGWNDRHAACLRPDRRLDNGVAAERRLRIGYVSPDFRRHSVAHFLEPLLQAHDRAAVEVFCYAEVARPDAVTERLRPLASHWRVTVGLSDAAVADRVRHDQIDILVDLAGHSANNRLLVFARKPAPIGVTWLGYPGTTGLSAIDYRLVDAVSDPEDAGWTSETLVRLADSFLCFRPLAGAPPVRSRDAASTTFGSFNNPTKLSTATLDAWSALLRRLPQARLLLKGAPFADASSRALFAARFTERGITSERITLTAHIEDDAGHLGLYHQVDVALDPFPYNGTTTTCEALWMGVPVVTLRGDRHAGRVGASLLAGLGLDELVAQDAAHYVEIAATLAGDLPRLKAMREGLRTRMAAAPLCDAQAFARRIEANYREMWRTWIKSTG